MTGGGCVLRILFIFSSIYVVNFGNTSMLWIVYFSWLAFRAPISAAEVLSNFKTQAIANWWSLQSNYFYANYLIVSDS